MNLFFLIYIAVIIYILIPICKIIWNDLLDNDLLYLLSSNYILLFMLSIIFNYQTNLIYSILISFTLMVFSFLLIRKIKYIYNRYQILSLPYLFFVVYLFSNIITLI